MSQRFSIDKQVAAVAVAGLGASYATANDPQGNPQHYAGAIYTLAYRAEATFDAATAIAGIKFKVQVSRELVNVGVATDTHWTDLALNAANAPDSAATVEQTIAASAGNTVCADFFVKWAHRGRYYFRVLVEKSGGGAAAGADAFALWATG